jgi:hypothetical protein
VGFPVFQRGSSEEWEPVDVRFGIVGVRMCTNPSFPSKDGIDQCIAEGPRWALDDKLNYQPGYPIYEEYHDYKATAKRAAEASVAYKEYKKRAGKNFTQLFPLGADSVGYGIGVCLFPLLRARGSL